MASSPSRDDGAGHVGLLPRLQEVIGFLLHPLAFLTQEGDLPPLRSTQDVIIRRSAIPKTMSVTDTRKAVSIGRRGRVQSGALSRA